jgi:peptide/nickel transport system permease protein
MHLALVSITLITILGIGFGIITSLMKGSFSDAVVTGITYFGMSIPQYVTGALLILLFAGAVFTLLPGWGFADFSNGFIPWIKHLILPSIAVSLICLAYTMRMTRNNILEVLQSDYVRTARLKGLSESTVIFRHVLGNALIPTITILAMTLGWLVGGLVIVEWVFSYPGLGRLIVEAISDRDVPLLKASALTMAAVYFLANFIADLLCTLLNPKERV